MVDTGPVRVVSHHSSFTVAVFAVRLIFKTIRRHCCL